MRKHTSLRLALFDAFPTLTRDPDKCGVFVDKGRVAARFGPEGAARCKGFEWSYTATLTLLDFTGDPNLLMIAVIDWVRINQPALLQNHQSGNDAVRFTVEALDEKKSDIEIELELNEAIDVDDNGKPIYRDEPTLETEWADGVPMSPLDRITVGGEVLIDPAD